MSKGVNGMEYPNEYLVELRSGEVVSNYGMEYRIECEAISLSTLDRPTLLSTAQLFAERRCKGGDPEKQKYIQDLLARVEGYISARKGPLCLFPKAKPDSMGEGARKQ